MPAGVAAAFAQVNQDTPVGLQVPDASTTLPMPHHQRTAITAEQHHLLFAGPLPLDRSLPRADERVYNVLPRLDRFSHPVAAA